MSMSTHIPHNELEEPAHYFALASGHVIALSVAIVFGLTVYAETDTVFKRTMAFYFMPTVREAQIQTAAAFDALFTR